MKPTPPPPSTPEKQDVYRQNYKPSVDILWVVDNSGSMADEQAAVSTNFPVFMEYFLGSNLDYHIGVVSTDMDNPDESGKLTEKQGYRWIDENTVDPDLVFTGMSNLGINGSSSEQGVLAAYSAMELQASYNAGFFRDEAAVHIITVSDEPDYSPDNPVTLVEFSDYLNNLRPTDDEVTYNTIVNPPPPDQCPATLGNADGRRYVTINMNVGGINWPVCDGNWAAILEMLGLQTAGLKREYFLSELPVLDSIEVTVEDMDGTSYEFVEGDDWTYSETRNSVTFVTYVPNEGSSVMIDYLGLAALEAD